MQRKEDTLCVFLNFSHIQREWIKKKSNIFTLLPLINIYKYYRTI